MYHYIEICQLLSTTISILTETDITGIYMHTSKWRGMDGKYYAY